MKRRIKSLSFKIFLVSSFTLFVACGYKTDVGKTDVDNNNSVKFSDSVRISEDDSVYTSEEAAAIQEGINVNKENIKIMKNTVKELEENKEEIISNNDIERIFKLTHNNKKKTGNKLADFSEGDTSGDYDSNTFKLRGITNKNKILSDLILHTVPLKKGTLVNPEGDSAVSDMKTSIDIEYGDKTVEQVYESELSNQKSSIDMISKANKYIKELLKENKSEIPKLNNDQEAQVNEILEINQNNISKLSTSIEALENNKDLLIESGDNEKVYDFLETVENMLSTGYYKELEESNSGRYDDTQSYNIVEETVDLITTDKFGVDRMRLVQSLCGSIEVSTLIQAESKEGKELRALLQTDKTIEDRYEHVLNVYRSAKEMLEEYNKVLENSLEGKNYIIDSEYFNTEKLLDLSAFENFTGLDISEQ